MPSKRFRKQKRENLDTLESMYIVFYDDPDISDKEYPDGVVGHKLWYPRILRGKEVNLPNDEILRLCSTFENDLYDLVRKQLKELKNG